MKRHDITGQTFGRLTAIKFVRQERCGAVWACRCECGSVGEASIGPLRNGHTRSCGCLVKSLMSERSTTHGRRYTSEYKSWCGILERCNNPNNHKYPIYGGRGIEVCKRWLSFENFYDDMGDKPAPQYSIDRIDTNGDYHPDNCRWATPVLQARNRRATKGNTGVNGVYWKNANGKFQARITDDLKKRRSLGYFHDFFEAVCARKSAEIRLWRAEQGRSFEQ